MNQLTYSEVQDRFPEAWNALPEPYKNDSCLVFYTRSYPFEQLFAAPKPGDEQAMGTQEYVWLPDANIWAEDSF